MAISREGLPCFNPKKFQDLSRSLREISLFAVIVYNVLTTITIINLKENLNNLLFTEVLPFVFQIKNKFFVMKIFPTKVYRRGQHRRNCLLAFLEKCLNDPSKQNLINWIDEPEGLFQILWIHGGKSNYQRDTHGCLFDLYREYRGRSLISDPKQTFRMALKKSPCIKAAEGASIEDWRKFRIIHKCHDDVLLSDIGKEDVCVYLAHQIEIPEEQELVKRLQKGKCGFTCEKKKKKNDLSHVQISNYNSSSYSYSISYEKKNFPHITNNHYDDAFSNNVCNGSSIVNNHNSDAFTNNMRNESHNVNNSYGDALSNNECNGSSNFNNHYDDTFSNNLRNESSDVNNHCSDLFSNNMHNESHNANNRYGDVLSNNLYKGLEQGFTQCTPWPSRSSLTIYDNCDNYDWNTNQSVESSQCQMKTEEDLENLVGPPHSQLNTNIIHSMNKHSLSSTFQPTCMEGVNSEDESYKNIGSTNHSQIGGPFESIPKENFDISCMKCVQEHSNGNFQYDNDEVWKILENLLAKHSMDEGNIKSLLMCMTA